ncbi:MAG TPA: cation-transporting P-type ATPase, partial [Dehalococcoidia bacterium]|nr:cation-transporting P-type ATPase [Dehalococcoidia bacterium]
MTTIDSTQLDPGASRAHAVPGDAVLHSLGVLAGRGLSPEEARERLLRFGPNSLPGARQRNTLLRAIAGQVR